MARLLALPFACQLFGQHDADAAFVALHTPEFRPLFPHPAAAVAAFSTDCRLSCHLPGRSRTGTSGVHRLRNLRQRYLDWQLQHANYPCSAYRLFHCNLSICTQTQTADPRQWPRYRMVAKEMDSPSDDALRCVVHYRNDLLPALAANGYLADSVVECYCDELSGLQYHCPPDDARHSTTRCGRS